MIEKISPSLVLDLDAGIFQNETTKTTAKSTKKNTPNTLEPTGENSDENISRNKPHLDSLDSMDYDDNKDGYVSIIYSDQSRNNWSEFSHENAKKKKDTTEDRNAKDIQDDPTPLHTPPTQATDVDGASISASGQASGGASDGAIGQATDSTIGGSGVGGNTGDVVVETETVDLFAKLSMSSPTENADAEVGDIYVIYVMFIYMWHLFVFACIYM